MLLLLTLSYAAPLLGNVELVELVEPEKSSNEAIDLGVVGTEGKGGGGGVKGLDIPGRVEAINLTAEEQTGATDLISAAVRIVQDWRSIGWLAGLIAFINFLILLLRFGPIDLALTRLDYKWIKPLLATTLGGLLGGFSTLATDASVLNSVFAGVLAGLGSVGFHQLIDTLKTNLRKRVREDSGNAVF